MRVERKYADSFLLASVKFIENSFMIYHLFVWKGPQMLNWISVCFLIIQTNLLKHAAENRIIDKIFLTQSWTLIYLYVWMKHKYTYVRLMSYFVQIIILASSHISVYYNNVYLVKQSVIPNHYSSYIFLKMPEYIALKWLVMC